MPFTGMETGAYSSGFGGPPSFGSGGGGFNFGQLFSNPLVLQMMASMGANLDPQGAGGAIGGVTNQWIQNQSYMNMMKKMLGGGAKITIGDGKLNITGDLGKINESLKSDESMSMNKPAFASYVDKMFPAGQSQR